MNVHNRRIGPVIGVERQIAVAIANGQLVGGVGNAHGTRGKPITQVIGLLLLAAFAAQLRRVPNLGRNTSTRTHRHTHGLDADRPRTRRSRIVIRLVKSAAATT